MKPKYNEDGRCPICGSTNVIYGECETNDEGQSYDVECEDCGAIWTECYDLVFAGNWRIMDKAGNEYEDMPVETVGIIS